MSTGRSKALQGGSLPNGDLIKYGIIGVLVIIVLILGFLVLSDNGQIQSQQNSVKNVQAALDTMNDSYGQLYSSHATLQTDYNKMLGDYQQLNASYIDVNGKYNLLKNQSDNYQVKMGDFLEAAPTIAYTYSIVVDNANNSTNQLVTAIAYNVGQQDANNVVASIVIVTPNDTGMLTKTIPLIPSMNKAKVTWIIDNQTTVQRVWVGVSS